MDRYTKVMLTIIAVSLSIIAGRDLLPSPAAAQFEGQCGSSSAPCYIEMTTMPCGSLNDPCYINYDPRGIGSPLGLPVEIQSR
jgi:hypothetical protein